MLAFLDESGDPGRKVTGGSSRYFTVAVVTFESAAEATACDNRIHALRSELSLPRRYEFHFHSNARSIRRAFLDAVAPFNFRYHAFSLNKDPKKLYGPGFDYKGPLYKYVCRLVMENATPFLHDATVVIDKSGDRLFRRQLASYLRQNINQEGATVIRKVKMEHSKTNNLVQLADYVAGVMNRLVTDKPDALDYLDRIVHREGSRREWP